MIFRRITRLVLLFIIMALQNLWGLSEVAEAAIVKDRVLAEVPPNRPSAQASNKPSYKPKGALQEKASKSSAVVEPQALMSSGISLEGGHLQAGAIPVTSGLDLFTGRFTAEIPLLIPPGRHGTQPLVQLQYRAGAPNNWTGVGWQLEPGAIERTGTDYTQETYVLRLNGGAIPLIQLRPGGTDFHARIGGGFFRIKKLAADGASGWEMTSPGGMKHFFGRTAERRRADPASPSTRIFTWLLDRIQDPDGNYVSFTYWTDTANNEVYLDEITYTGFGTTDGPHSVKFYLETRADAPDLYVPNYRITTSYRLKSIAARTNGTLQRAYALAYEASASTGRSRLTRVQQFGKDASVNSLTGEVSGGTSLPALTLGYQEGPTAFTDGSSWVTAWCGGGAILGDTDFNGDGKNDLLCRTTSYPISASAVISNGNGAFASWSVASAAANGIGPDDMNGDGKTDLRYDSVQWLGCWSPECFIYSLSVALSNESGTISPSQWADWLIDTVTGDFNGDGKKDGLYIESATGSSEYQFVSLSTGNGFSWGWEWTHNSMWCGRTASVADLNGDGLDDVYCHTSSGTTWAALSTGSSFGGETAWQTNFCVSGQFGTGDFNGDGKQDVYCHPSDGTTQIALSTGSTFTTPGIWLSNWCATGSFGIGDFNGDGKQDLYCHPTDGTTAIALSTGSAFTDSGTWMNGWCTSGSLGVGDFNGDGKQDVFCASGGQVHVARAGDSLVLPDLLVSVANGLGGTTAITYTPSTQFTNTQLPYPVQVVSSLTTSDGNGNVATTSYTYSGGFHHIAERDFRGFNYVKVTGPTGPNGEQSNAETWFHQGNDVAVDVNNPNVATGYMKGTPYRTKTTDGSGNVVAESTTAYAADADSAAPWFTPPSQVLAWTCSGTSSSCTNAKQTRTDFTYNHTYGNVEREDQYGDTSVSTDDRTIVRTFSPNATDWIISLPASETIYAGIGTTTQKAQTIFYYDGTTSCGTASTNQTPTKGLLTRIVRLLSGGTSPETRMAHDSYGNQICVRDPRGNTTTIAYDSGTNTFPLTVTNALNHVATTTYYGVNGVAMDSGLFGQVKSVTDPNGRTAGSTYDSFGRPSTSTAANGLVTTTTYNDLGTVGSQHVLSSRTVNGVTFQSWTYFDGLGRTIKAKSTGPQSPSAQNIVTQTVYNVRGQVSQSSLPFFEGGTPLWRTMTYDALGRVKTVTTPDGKVTATCYDPWVTVVIDPNQHKRRETRDATGRTVTVQEYTGSYDPSQCNASGGSPYATTSYAYDVLGNLTTVTDALGNQSTMTYDTLSRKTAMHDPDMGNWSYVYDAAGNLTQQTDAKSQNLYFQYDALNRRRQKDFGTQKALGSGDVVYTYDGATANNLVGRLAQVADGTGTVTFQYDVLGQISSSTRTLFTTPYTFTYTRDTLSRLSTITYPDNSVITYTYNGPFADQVKEGSTVYAQYNNYNALGQPVSTSYSNGVNTYFTYETNTFRLKSLQTTKSSTTLQNLEYAYDNVGNVQSLTDYLATANSQTFTYDELNRLLTGTSTAYGTITYTYNPIGNMTSNSQVGTYTYPTSGSSSVRPHAVTTAGSNSYTYDANGNMLTGAGRTFNSYDVENHPTSLTSGGTTTTFVYDGDGGRVKKQTGSTVTWYISKLYECDGASCTKMIFSGDKRIVAKPVGLSSLYFYHGDHLGSTSVVTDSTGAQVQALTYYPFGQTRTNVPGTPVNVAHKYTDQELDSATGLYDYNARLYDPVLGRFTSADTLIPNPFHPQDFNRYSYVRNNPLKYIDPTGHCGTFGGPLSPEGTDAIMGCLWNLFSDLFGPAPPQTSENVSTTSTAPSPGPPTIVSTPEIRITDTRPDDGIGRVSGRDLLDARWLLGLDSLQRGLDAAGFVPALNTPAGLANAAISGFRGQYTEAGLSALTAIPVLGTIGKYGHSAEQVLKHLESILKPGGKLIGEAGSRADFRVMSGDMKAAEDLVLDLGKLGQIRNHPRDPGGVAFDLPGEGFVGLRESTKYGPTIDINVRGLEDITKIHFR